MKALSVKQPWLDAILYGNKTTENRTWAPGDQLGARILLHASAAPDRRAVLPHDTDTTKWSGIRSAILAVATPADYHLADACCRPWGEPQASSAERPVYHWCLTDIHLLEPIPCPGALRFWTPPADVLNAVTTQLASQD